ncbi:MAG: hypothetical protein ABJK64_19125 [Paraglaciecola sp.]|uniref:hypothetical protein n=1 Tax=Paraglaciecola sp. TaxID=1920173 RepID=UPI00329A3B79
MKLLVLTWLSIFSCGLLAINSTNNSITIPESLKDVTNIQVNSMNMISSGLPSDKEFRAFKKLGVSHIIDLIPGNRNEEIALLDELDLNYLNIQVEWQNPTINNFLEYVTAMNLNLENDNVTLTHCKLNWRGAVFTYLYKITQLNVNENKARAEMESIWKPNPIWSSFIEEVKLHYSL